MKRFSKCSLKGLMIGSIVAVVLIIFYIITTKNIKWTYVGVTFMFSVSISTIISYFTLLVDDFREKYKLKNPFIIWAAYYLAAMVGMTIASESCLYILYRFILYKPYHLFIEPNQLLVNLVISLVVTTIAGVYQNQKTNMEIKIKEKELDISRLSQLKTQAELQTLQSRINPHFLYNSLNSIASLIHIDPDKAEDMTMKLSKLFRYSINTQNENTTTIKEEIEIVKTYLEIEKVRFADRINFKIDAEPTLHLRHIPRFILQPLVENSLKHGLANMVEGGLMHLEIKENEKEELEIIIADNGAPFPEELQAGYGLQSTYEKLQLLYGTNYQLHIANEPKKHIKIIIPIV